MSDQGGEYQITEVVVSQPGGRQVVAHGVSRGLRCINVVLVPRQCSIWGLLAVRKSQSWND